MQNENKSSLYSSLAKALVLAAGIIILLWLLSKIVSALLMLLFALVLAIIINAPVNRLEQKGMKRGWACTIVFGTIVLSLALLGWLVVPKVSEQFQALLSNLPTYIDTLSGKVSGWFSSLPGAGDKFKEDGINFSKWLPSVPNALLRVGNYSLSLFGAIVIFIIFISMVVYAVTNPKPLLEIYFLGFPPAKRETAAKAFQHAAQMLTGWFRANLIGGSIEAACTVLFLSVMNVPGAWVWGALALFAELVPKIGFYIMSIPPVLVALSVGPTTALWVAIFFLALNEIMGDFVMPRLRSSTMSIHPVSSLFLMLAMGSAFGFIGALLATPMAAIVKAYYYAFYVKGQNEEKAFKKHVEEALSLPKSD